MKSARILLLLNVLPLAGASVRAQDCTGISPAPSTELTTVRVASVLNRPTFLTAPPGDTERLFILEENGLIVLVKNGVKLTTPFLDVVDITHSSIDGGGSEEGLLGMAFSPGFAADGAFYIYHTVDGGHNNVVARYAVSAMDPDRADPASRQIVITLPHPNQQNHNGGMLAFGPDGYLYLGVGDGGSGCDPPGNAQNLGTHLGKILRIDVGTFPYAIPADNPFVGLPGAREEIWAYGLRNPWRFSFDPQNGDLLIGDVGQSEWEEIDYEAPGGSGGANYGWDPYEGSTCPNPSCFTPPSACELPDHVPPVLEYSHDEGCSVAAGYVYRGCRMPDLHGTFFWADFCSALMGSFRVDGGVAVDQRDRTAELQPGGGMAIGEITSFGIDGRGEMYILDLGGTVPVVRGEAYKIVPILANLEVSGVGAASMLLGAGAWSWEDLGRTSHHPITSYRVYRSTGNGSGTFVCLFETPVPSWDGGDPEIPPLAGLYSYLVTAMNADGEETRPGEGTSGLARALSTASCPP